MNPRDIRYNNDRYFLFPFLLGGLAGGAAVGLTRPRPIYNVAPQASYPAPYYYNSYGYYRPMGYPYY